jgi:hypothetical protein
VDHAVPSPLTARRAGALKGRLRVPGDKSISHRALIFGALTVGETHISGLLEGEDVINTAKAMRALGATVERIGEGTWRVHGVGVGGFREPQAVLDFGNSGTGCRLVMGAVAGCPVTATFDGDASLRKRPMRRILDPVELIGARTVSATDGGRLPITLAGARDPLPVVYRTPTFEQADEFLRITDDPANRPIFIHCTAAIRVAGFWMIRRVLRDNWTFDAALEEAKKIGLVNAPHLEEFAKAYIARKRSGA